MGGHSALPFVLRKMILFERPIQGVRERALALFAAKARHAIGLAGEVSILVAGSARIQELNRRFRKKNKPTDVLSFPSEAVGVAGDLALSADIAAENAALLGHSAETELKVLILHGILHLAGYDHENDAGEMRTRESELRRKFRLPGGLIERTDSSALAGAHSRRSAMIDGRERKQARAGASR